MSISHGKSDTSALLGKHDRSTRIRGSTKYFIKTEHSVSCDVFAQSEALKAFKLKSGRYETFVAVAGKHSHAVFG